MKAAAEEDQNVKKGKVWLQIIIILSNYYYNQKSLK